PFLLGNSDTSEAESGAKTSAWEREPPAPSASPAPAWQSGAEAAPSWQFPPGGYESSEANVPATSAWNEDSQSPGWAERSQPPSWEGAREARSRDSRLDVPASGEPTSTQAWTGPSEPAPSSSRPQWQVPAEPESGPAWNAPTNFESGNPPLDQTGWNSLPEKSAEPYRQPTNSWNEPTETPSWRVPEYRTAGQLQARSPAPAGYESYRAPVESYQQVEAGTNRPTTIDDYSPSGTPDYRTDYAQDRQDGYRTADTRAAVPYTGRADYPTGVRSTVPDTGYPQTSYPQTSYPPTSYPQTSYPQTSYPPAVYRPSTGYSEGRYPAGDSPAAGLRATEYAPTGDSRYGYPPRTSEPPLGATSTSGYGVGVDARYPQPGVARFQGGIEKPTESSVYDRDRSGVY
ncbi:MAG: hypothetical protein ABIK89_02510, partial [Planctomycetota bacterium]